MYKRRVATMKEASKCAHRVMQYLNGMGVDIGCGNDKVKPDAIGIDKNQSSDATIIWSDLNALPFKSRSLDYVFSSHCLEDLRDKYSALVEWLRILKPGGYLILYLPHKSYYPNIGTPFANKDHYEDIDENDIIQVLEAIKTHKRLKLEIVSCKVYAPPGEKYDFKKRETIEYSFEMVVQKK